MLSLFKQKQKETVAVVDTAPRLIVGTVIRTMPDKFLVVEEHHRFWTPLKLWSVAIIVIGSLVATTYWLVTSVQAPASAPQAASEQTATSPAAATNTTGGNMASGTLPTTPSPDTAPAPGSETQTNEPPTPVTPPPVTALLPNSADTDTDGLTNSEETLFGTNPAKPDSDADGYSDLDELKNGYNPIGTGKLQGGSLFTAYSDPNGRYSVRYPVRWTTRPIGRDGIQFVSAADESIAVLVQNNPSKLAIGEWYRASIAGAVATLPVLETVGEHTGIFSPDRQTFYFTSPGASKDVYVVSLTSGAKTTLDFRATYELFIQFLHLSS
ncbi:MAG: thrombospondin type 3 repeat-containing protein [Patescibacteria group bacterium]|jgi:hypothetical protein